MILGIYYLGVLISSVIWILCFKLVDSETYDFYLNMSGAAQFTITVFVTLFWLPLLFFVWGVMQSVFSFLKNLIKK